MSKKSGQKQDKKTKAKDLKAEKKPKSKDKAKKDNKIKKPKKLKDIKITTENKCDLCTGSLCCTYITQEIETPRSKVDFNHLLWQVSHDNVEIYKDEDGWTLMFKTLCTHLQIDGRCGIYDKRPDICREYENDYCEYDSPPEDGWDLHFTDFDQLYKYASKKFKRWP